MSALHLKRRWGQGLAGGLPEAGGGHSPGWAEYCLTPEAREWVRLHSTGSQSWAGSREGADVSNLHRLSAVAPVPASKHWRRDSGCKAHITTMLRILLTVSLMLIGAMTDRVFLVETEKQGPCDRQPGPQAGGSWKSQANPGEWGKPLGSVKCAPWAQWGHLKVRCGV